MKLRLWLLYASLLAAIASCNAPHPNEANLISEMDSISYAVGMDIAQHYYQNQNVELNPDLLYQGFRDQALSTDQKLSEEEMKALIKGFTDKLRAEHRAEMQKIASTNQKLEEEFLSENRTKSEVQELPSGLQYKVLGQGSGTSPKLDQVVKVNYEGRMLNGTVFTPRGEREIDLTATLLGLQEALTLMRPGDHWEVYVPAKMAWGEAERGPVTPNSLLIFDLELLEILP